jgi:hypothetical protein
MRIQLSGGEGLEGMVGRPDHNAGSIGDSPRSESAQFADGVVAAMFWTRGEAGTRAGVH